MKNAIEIQTKAFESGQIEQEIYATGNGIRHRIQRGVIDTSETQIRAALVTLGWTPPQVEGAVDVDVTIALPPLMPGSCSPAAPDYSRTSSRLSQESIITNKTAAAQALNHIAQACSEDLRQQGMALQDFAVPALRWAILRIGVLEADGRSERRTRVGPDSRPAPL